MIPVLQSDIRKVFDKSMIHLLPKLGLAETDVAWPNARFCPDPSKPYLRFDLLPGRSVATSLGPRCLVKMVGIYQISIFYPKDAGIGKAEEMAGIILNSFPFGKTLEFCRYVIVVTSVYCNAIMQDEDRLLLPVNLVYECYVLQHDIAI